MEVAEWLSWYFVNCPSVHFNHTTECDALRKAVSELQDPVCSKVYDGKRIYEVYMFLLPEFKHHLEAQNVTLIEKDVTYN